MCWTAIFPAVCEALHSSGAFYHSSPRMPRRGPLLPAASRGRAGGGGGERQRERDGEGEGEREGGGEGEGEGGM